MRFTFHLDQYFMNSMILLDVSSGHLWIALSQITRQVTPAFA